MCPGRANLDCPDWLAQSAAQLTEFTLEATGLFEFKASRIYNSLKQPRRQEPGSGGKESAEATIRMLAGYRVFADRPGADRSKEVRAEPLAAQVQGGNVFLHAGTWQRDLLDAEGSRSLSLLAIPASKGRSRLSCQKCSRP